MPIKVENRARYPKNWKDITARIRERAGNCCEGSPAYPDCRAANGQSHPVTGSRVVLTVAHLDHMPEHCDPSNLRAWCQRCHITYDAPRKAQDRAHNRLRAATLAHALDELDAHGPHAAAEDRARQLTPGGIPAC